MRSKIMLPGFIVLLCSAVISSATPATILIPRAEDVSSKQESDTKIQVSVDENQKINSQNLSEIFYQTSGSKFYVSKIAVNWDDATKICKDVGMALASISSQKEQLELYKYLFVNDLVPVDDFSGYWLSGLQQENGLYKWTSTSKHIDCWGWLPGEPSHIDDLEHCVELKYEAGSVRLGWNNFMCSRRNKFICQQLPGSNKDSPNDQHITVEQNSEKEPETKCYYFYKINQEPVPYEFEE